MDFAANQELQIRQMLEVIGVSSVEQLFESIPAALRLNKPSVDDGLSEYEALEYVKRIAEKNTFGQFCNYIGAGAYQHQIPAITDAIIAKSEFLTAYTPYQPEISQGMLQAIFEYQSVVCALTGLDVSNASVYDGASATAESLLMALRANKERKTVLISEGLHPLYRKVVDQYLSAFDGTIVTLPLGHNGMLEMKSIRDLVKEDVAAVLIQSPNFLGHIEEVGSITPLIRQLGGLSILVANPLAYGIFASAKDLHVDIACGDMQPFGIPLQFGGPYTGYIACQNGLQRQLPGRIVGETKDTKGRRGFVLTLQAREQHIRREKATSNICTNQALMALASLVTVYWYGKKGIKELALMNYSKTAYLKEGLTALPGCHVSQGSHFNEFTISFPRPMDLVLGHFRKKGIEPGLPLDRFLPRFRDKLLVCVTEVKSKEELDTYLQTAKELL